MTVTSWVALAVLPAGSVAVYVRVVMPTGKLLKVGLRVTIALPELSDAIAAPSAALLTVASQPSAPGPVKAVLSDGAVIVGAVLSTTVMT